MTSDFGNSRSCVGPEKHGTAFVVGPSDSESRELIQLMTEQPSLCPFTVAGEFAADHATPSLLSPACLSPSLLPITRVCGGYPAGQEWVWALNGPPRPC